jgi:hypothetical protein
MLDAKGRAEGCTLCEARGWRLQKGEERRVICQGEIAEEREYAFADGVQST